MERESAEGKSWSESSGAFNGSACHSIQMAGLHRLHYLPTALRANRDAIVDV